MVFRDARHIFVDKIQDFSMLFSKSFSFSRLKKQVYFPNCKRESVMQYGHSHEYSYVRVYGRTFGVLMD